MTILFVAASGNRDIEDAVALLREKGRHVAWHTPGEFRGDTIPISLLDEEKRMEAIVIPMPERDGVESSVKEIFSTGHWYFPGKGASGKAMAAVLSG